MASRWVSRVSSEQPKGYRITAHKSQGTSWAEVLLYPYQSEWVSEMFARTQDLHRLRLTAMDLGIPVLTGVQVSKEQPDD